MGITQHSSYDVIVIGGGMVGTSLAYALQQAPAEIDFKVLLIETFPISLNDKPLQPSFDARSTVLSFGTAEYFRQLGLWDDLSEFTEAIKDIHVSDQGKFGAVRMDSKKHEVDALGYVVENKAIGTVLNNAVLNASRIEICSPAKVVSINPEPDAMNVSVEKGEETVSLSAKLVVLAEGGRSGICQQLGIHRTDQSYSQVAIIANVAFSEAHKNIAYERFTPKGPMALLPLRNLNDQNRAALVWTHSADSVEEIMSLDEPEFLKALQSDFGSRLGEFTKMGERKSFPLSLQQAEEQVRPGLVLLGNVAHSLHPVAGQGFNLALRDTMRLASTIIDSIKVGENPGAIKSLQAYCTKTEGDQDKTIAFSHYMTGLFSNDNEVLVWARKFGLLSVDLVPPLKKGLGWQAMGMSEPLVSL